MCSLQSSSSNVLGYTCTNQTWVKILAVQTSAATLVVHAHEVLRWALALVLIPTGTFAYTLSSRGPDGTSRHLQGLSLGFPPW